MIKYICNKDKGKDMISMKIWLDSEKKAPKGYLQMNSTQEAQHFISNLTPNVFWDEDLELIDIGDIQDIETFFFWLEKTYPNTNFNINIHTEKSDDIGEFFMAFSETFKHWEVNFIVLYNN